MKEGESVKKNSFIFIVLLMLFICGCGETKRNDSLELQGNCYENLNDFMSYSEGNEVSELSQAYLKKIDYEVINLDKENMTVTLKVKIPNVIDALAEIIRLNVEENDFDMPYEELYSIVEKKFVESLANENFETEVSEILLPIEKVGDRYKIVLTEEWFDLIYGKLISSYIDMCSELEGENKYAEYQN